VAAPAQAAVSGPRTRPRTAAPAGASNVREKGVSTRARVGQTAVTGRALARTNSATAKTRYAVPALTDTLNKGKARAASSQARPTGGATAQAAMVRATSGSVQLAG